MISAVTYDLDKISTSFQDENNCVDTKQFNSSMLLLVRKMRINGFRAYKSKSWIHSAL